MTSCRKRAMQGDGMITALSESEQRDKSDRFGSTLTWMTSVLPEGKPLCKEVEIEEVEQKNDPHGPDTWEVEISTTGAGGSFVYPDGSMLEGGNVGGSAIVVLRDGAEEEAKCGIGGCGMERWLT